MKRSTLLIVFCLAIVVLGKAQNWCPPGASWHYYENGFIAGVDGVVEFNYTNDVVINNVLCKKIVGTFTGKHWTTGINTNTVIANFKSYFTYEANGVLFLYNGSTFDTVVNYNAAIGDKWLRLRAAGGGGCNSRRALTVIDTGHVTINGFYLKKIVTSYTNSFWFNSAPALVTNTNTFVERVYNYLGDGFGNEMFPLYCEIDNLIADYPFVTFRCYQDNNFPLYSMVQYGCNSLTGLNTAGEIENMVSVFPNPVKNVLTVDLTQGFENAEVSVLDIYGRVVMARPQSQDSRSKTQETRRQLDLSSLSQGIYFVSVSKGGTLIYQSKLIKE